MGVTDDRNWQQNERVGNKSKVIMKSTKQNTKLPRKEKRIYVLIIEVNK